MENKEIEIDSLDLKKTEGWGWIIDNQLYLRKDMPFLFNSKKDAVEGLLDCNYVGNVIYQRWDIEKKQVLLGEVVFRGTD